MSLVFAASIFVACEQESLTSSEEKYDSRHPGQSESVRQPVGANASVDSLKHISEVLSLRNDSTTTEASIIMDFFPEEKHSVFFQRQGSTVTYASESDNTMFEMTINNSNGETHITLDGENFYIPPFQNISESDADQLKENLKSNIDIEKVEKIVFAIHEVRMQTRYRSSSDPRLNTKFDIEANASISRDDLQLDENMSSGQDVEPQSGYGWNYSSFICCAYYNHESFGSAFGPTPGIAYNNAYESIQFWCGCFYCLGCVSYIGPDVYSIFGGWYYFAEGCGQKCYECAYC